MEAEEYDKLPIAVKDIINSFNDDNNDSYSECRRIKEELEKIGWTCDYDLGASIVDVEVIKTKNYYLQHNIGKAKYVVSYYGGVKTHPDGSRQYDMAIFKNKIKLNKFIKELEADGYTYR